MKIKACRTPEQVEEHWRRIIEAVRGKKMCQVWYEFKLGLVQQASVTNPQGPAVQGEDDPTHSNAE